MMEMLEFEKKVKRLDDTNLLKEMTQLFQEEKELGDTILLGLKEIKQRKLFAGMGYPTLFEFLNKYFRTTHLLQNNGQHVVLVIES